MANRETGRPISTPRALQSAFSGESLMMIEPTTMDERECARWDLVSPVFARMKMDSLGEEWSARCARVLRFRRKSFMGPGAHHDGWKQHR